MKLSQRIASLALLLAGGAAMLFAQSTGTITQTVNQRNTIGILSATPNGTITAGNPIAFTYVLNTAGAPAPTTETVQFYDGSTALGTPQTIGLSAAANLLPYSQVNTGKGWTTSGTAPTVASLTGWQHQYSDCSHVCECNLDSPLCGAGNNQLCQSASDLLDLGTVGNSNDTQSHRAGQPLCGCE
jgi:hypothetical protein